MTHRLARLTPSIDMIASDDDRVIVLPSTPDVMRPLRSPLVEAAVLREPMLQLRFDADRSNYDLVVSGAA